MRPNPKFVRLPKHFWANVRTISQQLGYTDRPKRQAKKGKKVPEKKAAKQSGPIKIPSLAQVVDALTGIGLTATHLADAHGQPTELGQLVLGYYEYRAAVLNNEVRSCLMDKDRAKALFQTHRKKLCPNCPLPMNKQKGKKKAPAYFTGLINMLIEANAEGLPCNYDPRELTTVTLNSAPLRTLARRVDGAFPGPVNPIAVWEVKEYYYTTTFGSRVADGVYETLLDGLELEELLENEKIEVKHYLMVDDFFTWWDCGRSYLCRIIDMLHMGYVDEVLFGYEVIDRLPVLIKEWVSLYHARHPGKDNRVCL